MVNPANRQKLSDNNISPNKKLRSSVYLKKETYLKIDRHTCYQIFKE